MNYELIGSKNFYRPLIISLLLLAAIIIPTSVFLLNKNHYTLHIPPIEPPVYDTAPEGFEIPSRRFLQHEYSNEVKQRFFSGDGPTDIYGLLDSVDQRTQSLNNRMVEQDRPCLRNEPVKINVQGFSGNENIEIFVQCYDELSNNFFIMFGKKDGIMYLYEKGPATTTTALIEDTNETLPNVDVYFTVGNGMLLTQSGSRGLFHIKAEPKNDIFEGTAAGIGLGFCGVQFKSNGNNVKTIGSVEGPGGTCQPINETCTDDNLQEMQLANCNQVSFSLTPLGRKISTNFLGPHNLTRWEASRYAGNVEIGDMSENIRYGPQSIPNIIKNNQYKF
jgi:hypothetical protein